MFSTCLGTLDRQEYFTVKKTKKQFWLWCIEKRRELKENTGKDVVLINQGII